ncbi:hypothetical protein PDIG_70920 [Penicillium digitatum PHI26]|uniref:Uncharacterized protein n=2 Tax=Penicillium digitatum TaxID=36651 RepID=K9G443_PEND2|nr:hypothetical protein PDIP_80240 [Penicillium digitatum Pd1]EKV06313.1 hypothetical protein PDIP_80240 [Penicillium digitatum Pd1]EKV08016.1 hypothetical protein PDIG_70920 [Penicillium digitatum PHI26]
MYIITYDHDIFCNTIPFLLALLSATMTSCVTRFLR